MHLLVSADDSERFLLDELRRVWPAGHHAASSPGLLMTDATLDVAPPPRLVFARQMLPDAEAATAESISGWGERLRVAIAAGVTEAQPWLLHVAPHYGSGPAGRNRCRLIVENLRERLRRRHRALGRAWRPDPEPFGPGHSLVQLLLTAPDRGWLSIAGAPRPHQLRTVLSPFPLGEIPAAVDKGAPSRAFAKLLEAELRLGHRIARGETCVDLGASPGSWTYVALQRGARVIAVDRAPLRDDLMRASSLEFHQGDAFKFIPENPVDWLLCDVIAAPERSIALVLDWARHRRARRFVVTIKFQGHEDYGLLEPLKQAMPPWCHDFFLLRLCANKNEACAFGTIAGGSTSA